jgi:ABC transporter
MALLTRFQFPSKRWCVQYVLHLMTCSFDLKCSDRSLRFLVLSTLKFPIIVSVSDLCLLILIASTYILHTTTKSNYAVIHCHDRYDRVGQMSGGERRRLQLLQVLARAPNVLLLDEPSKLLLYIHSSHQLPFPVPSFIYYNSSLLRFISYFLVFSCIYLLICCHLFSSFLLFYLKPISLL